MDDKMIGLVCALIGLLGVLLGIFLNNLFSKYMWLNTLRYETYRRALKILEKYEYQALDQSIQKNEALDFFLGTGVRLPREAYFTLISFTHEIKNIFKAKAVGDFCSLFWINYCEERERYIDHRIKAIAEMTKEMGLPCCDEMEMPDDLIARYEAFAERQAQSDSAS